MGSHTKYDVLSVKEVQVLYIVYLIILV